MTAPYVLTAAAEDDLRSIIRHTRKQWGNAQVRSYLAKLEQGIVRIATGDGVFKEMGELYPGLRMVHCEHHYIFCLPRAAEPALIVAILHERMELIMRLEGRLK
ncbi:type II toxin-antitoxin system RelE/ParE family toxin [Novosphingobium sp. BW1]|uniref:type II toxin-antitoxin system RelE/ParE family toxin n=1 Tax=Novosphingobium sp. BW1 TaxID=2592621 RepID=UPI0011DEA71E|nr:type II toxin-antitoxin system RelE/ParE family toxin [Novosphingobium sp. BW1]TYC78751.1 type II toxin-antitoxin system RelE/ParE family toxin [Novosphingobium sp. BW1]